MVEIPRGFCRGLDQAQVYAIDYKARRTKYPCMHTPTQTKRLPKSAGSKQQLNEHTQLALIRLDPGRLSVKCWPRGLTANTEITGAL